MPLQVQRGYAVLEELEDALKSTGNNRAARLMTLSAKFYQVGWRERQLGGFGLKK